MDLTELEKNVDCIFYFILDKDGDKICLNEEIMNDLCYENRRYAAAETFAVRSGAELASVDYLREEWANLKESSIEIVFVETDSGETYLLSLELKEKIYEEIKTTSETDSGKFIGKLFEEDDGYFF